ncbi:MAG: sigma-70 family RNA polymerase sigma factor [Thermacetogeniaceae bacterium]
MAYTNDGSEENLKQIIMAGRPLVHHFANLYLGSRFSEDLIQAGYEGLLKALKRFDPGRGVRFVTFASHYIMGEIRHQLRREASFDRPGWVADIQSRIYRVMDDLLQKTGEPPSLEEIAEAVNIRKEGVIQALQAGRVSLETLDLNQFRHIYYENFKLPIEDQIAVRQALKRLNDMQRRVLYLIFYRDLTQQQVAKKMGIGQRKVSRLMHRGLQSMAEYLA